MNGVLIFFFFVQRACVSVLLDEVVDVAFYLQFLSFLCTSIKTLEYMPVLYLANRIAIVSDE